MVMCLKALGAVTARAELEMAAKKNALDARTQNLKIAGICFIEPRLLCWSVTVRQRSRKAKRNDPDLSVRAKKLESLWKAWKRVGRIFPIEFSGCEFRANSAQIPELYRRR